MTLLDQILGRLSIPGTLPEVVTRGVATLSYSQDALDNGRPEERAEVWQEMCEDLVRLLEVGFLARPFAAQVPVSASAVLTGPDKLVITVETSGAHVNLVHVLVRLIVATHHTPDDGFQRVLDAVDGDVDKANEVFGGLVYDRDVGALTVQVAGPEGLEPMPVDIRAALWHNVHVPASGPLGDAILMEAEETVISNLTFDDLDEETEDAFLTISSMNAFIPIGLDAVHEPGDEEMFLSGPGTLTVHTISIEQVFLFELVATLNGGDISRAQAEVTAA